MSKRLGGTQGCKDKTSSWHKPGRAIILDVEYSMEITKTINNCVFFWGYFDEYCCCIRVGAALLRSDLSFYLFHYTTVVFHVHSVDYTSYTASYTVCPF